MLRRFFKIHGANMVTRGMNDRSLWAPRGAGILLVLTQEGPAVLHCCHENRHSDSLESPAKQDTTWRGAARKYRPRIARALRGGCTDGGR